MTYQFSKPFLCETEVYFIYLKLAGHYFFQTWLVSDGTVVQIFKRYFTMKIFFDLPLIEQ